MTRPATLALLALASALAGCGGAAGGAAEEPKSPDLSSEDVATPERAYAAVGRAEGELVLALGPARGAGDKEKNPAAPEPPSPPPPLAQAAQPVAPAPPPPAEAPSRHKTGERETQQQGGGAPAATGSPCLTACAALASMERAADHLCTLAGAADARCTDARARVKSAAARVRTACPACGG